jgi:hypothetical protein
MPTFRDTRTRPERSSSHPVTEVLSRYLAMTAPERPRPGSHDRTSPRSPVTSSRPSVQRRAEELWDALGDFA